jgi:predicted transcriptional regulator
MFLPPDLQTDLDRLAAAAGRDPQALAEEALRRFVAYETKLALIRALVDEGDASGVFDGDPFDSVFAELGITSPPP